MINLFDQPLTLKLASDGYERELAFDIRRSVFCGEQHIPADLEFDGQDAQALHALAFKGAKPVGTARLLGQAGAWQLGRMAVLAGFRGLGIGKALLAALEKEALGRGGGEVLLDAQTAAKGFYEAQGYVAAGQAFEKAGIGHLPMGKKLESTKL